MNKIFKDICEELEWEVKEYEQGVEFIQYLVASGEKFYITLACNPNNTETILKSLEAYYEAFDVEEYVTNKLIAKKSGISGIPSLDILIDDAYGIIKLVKRLILNLGGRVN